MPRWRRDDGSPNYDELDDPDEPLVSDDSWPEDDPPEDDQDSDRQPRRKRRGRTRKSVKDRKPLLALLALGVIFAAGIMGYLALGSEEPSSGTDFALASSSTPLLQGGDSDSVEESGIDGGGNSQNEGSGSGDEAPASSPKPSSKNTQVAASSLKLDQSHSGDNFLEGWDFFTAGDPTHGLVKFLDREAAQSAGLVSTGDTFVLKADDKTRLGNGQPRESVRITSKKPVKLNSLILFDAKKIPYGDSVWPAFWTVGTNWPSNGEIDIVEQVNSVNENQYTLHTSAGCTLSKPMDATGRILVENCDVVPTGNAGCGIRDTSSKSYGPGFDEAGGGAFATLFAGDGIAVWFWSRNDIPADVEAGEPNPDSWGQPVARWDAKTCDIDKYFGDQTIVINITICGDWAGAVTPGCTGLVADPGNYKDARWEINYVKVYTL